jgi:hypothetical protein
MKNFFPRLFKNSPLELVLDLLVIGGATVGMIRVMPVIFGEGNPSPHKIGSLVAIVLGFYFIAWGISGLYQIYSEHNMGIPLKKEIPR